MTCETHAAFKHRVAHLYTPQVGRHYDIIKFHRRARFTSGHSVSCNSRFGGRLPALRSSGVDKDVKGSTTNSSSLSVWPAGGFIGVVGACARHTNCPSPSKNGGPTNTSSLSANESGTSVAGVSVVCGQTTRQRSDWFHFRDLHQQSLLRSLSLVHTPDFVASVQRRCKARPMAPLQPHHCESALHRILRQSL